MELPERKYIFAGAAIILLIASVGWWSYASSRDPKVSQEQVIKWINEGYPAQFCTAIYPHLADCMTFSIAECEGIAASQIQPCVNELLETIPQSMTKKESQGFYRSASACFEKNMHKHLYNNYLVNTPECRQRMS